MDDFTFDQNNRMVAHWNAFRSLSPPPPPIDCVNIPANWYDIYGDSCDWYANGNNCAFYGSDFAHPDFNSTALEACCVCGPTTTPEPTITPEPTVTFEPTLEPTLEPTNEPTITFEVRFHWVDHVSTVLFYLCSLQLLHHRPITESADLVSNSRADILSNGRADILSYLPYIRADGRANNFRRANATYILSNGAANNYIRADGRANNFIRAFLFAHPCE